MNQYLIGLSCLECLGPVSLNKILKLFGSMESEFDSAEDVWRASFFNFKEKGVPIKLAYKIIEQRKKIDLPKIINLIETEKILTVSLADKNYPRMLKEIYSPPPLLYYRGSVEAFNQPTNLAVVGSRKISFYCQSILPGILSGALKQNTTIISGLALGIDALAHQSACANKNKTIGVLASGLLWQDFYPKTNLKLAQQILATGGLIISEFPPLIKALSFNFPRRNRIIAGLAQAVLIAEAAEKSGALITADYALDFNRDILALPQNVNSPNSAGVNKLIQAGAALIASSNDLLKALNLEISAAGDNGTPENLNLTTEEKIIYKLLNDIPVQIDKISVSSNLDAAKTGSILIGLELKGIIKNVGGQRYIKL